MIKTDPSQTKTVIALLAILAVAVVATIMRIHPNLAQPSAAVAGQTAARQVGTAPCVTIIDGQTSKNPFRKPKALREQISRAAMSGIAFDMANGNNSSARSMNKSGLNFAPIGPMPVSTVSDIKASDTTKADTEKTKTQFALLATVGGPNGMTAVIRIGDSNTRVVSVGDMLDGDYRVAKLEDGRAVLKNGSDIVEIKRPS